MGKTPISYCETKSVHGNYGMGAAYPVALAAKIDPAKPWVGLPIQIPQITQVLFDVAIESLVGNGEGTKFWADRWLQGKSIQDLAPNLIKLVPKRISKKRTVKVTLNNRRWVFDIKGALTVQVFLNM